jgi:hypothetical protein
LKMAESLGQVKEKGKEDWHDGEEIWVWFFINQSYFNGLWNWETFWN